jgi:polyhydroxybutyrate depolymerase
MHTKYFILFIFSFFYSTILCAQYLNFEHQGQNRQYLLHIPQDCPPNAPLVIVMHGYTSNATTIRNYSGMNDIADQFGFAVCYPNGTIDAFNNRFFNAGYEFHNNETVDDVDFLIQLSSYLQETHNLSPDKTFSTGLSNGGDMSYKLACEATEHFKAIAPVAGTMMKYIYDNCTATGIPVFEIHGTNDDVTYYDGDLNNQDGWGAYMPIPDVIEFWKNTNNCQEYEASSLPNNDVNDGSVILWESYTDGINNSEVWLYKVINGGHDWPGAWGNMDVNSSLEIWYFFSKYLDPTNTIEHEFQNKFIQLAPNPGTDTFKLSGLQLEKKYNYKLYHSNGEIAEQGSIRNQILQLTKNHKDGLYLLFIENTGYAKMIIQR